MRSHWVALGLASQGSTGLCQCASAFCHFPRNPHAFPCVSRLDTNSSPAVAASLALHEASFCPELGPWRAPTHQPMASSSPVPAEASTLPPRHLMGCDFGWGCWVHLNYRQGQGYQAHKKHCERNQRQERRFPALLPQMTGMMGYVHRKHWEVL